ncbi:CRISPR type III-B/RAMP module-associated protein Cmr3 [Cyclobacterium xiamenense]|uniref:CRISPR type III-B/RAMP module-associated protein Cmr3 n=1 Tax=Cyclobacterium xiamenense TaxID=1297121 RepID=A0A1H7BWA2_9BACT|nr:type III-B CRISPR module-associated Cmr3 family protein [Cyclobacterium xiamenense]SEJ81839.1 CRISPR type III-B/RAMP module-associated protein Cmr3 [Cyclobacterium xiamenense]
MTDYNFKISLSPMEDYFFGGERTFGELSDQEGRNYFAYSNQYPQQTSLLGLLRYWLLVCNDCLPIEQNRELASSLIGNQSFSPQISEQPQNFGVIKKISPLLLQAGNTTYRFAHGLSTHQLRWQSGGSCYVAGTRTEVVPEIVGYDPKEENPMILIGDQGESRALKEIFNSHFQIGIKKGSDKQGFFKQQFYRLEKGARFVVYAHIDTRSDSRGDMVPTKLQDQIVFFGGEQRQFQVEVAQCSEDNGYPFGQSGTGDKFTLLSDAVVSSGIFQHCEFALSEIQEFRVGLFNADGFGFGGKSQKYNLLRRGSVLFAKNPATAIELKKLLDAPVNFRQIGFNHYFQEIYHKQDGKNK